MLACFSYNSIVLFVYPEDIAHPALTVNKAIHHRMFIVKLIEKANAVRYNMNLCTFSNELNIASLNETKFLMVK